MADYYSPCVVTPPIPLADLSATEAALLLAMFEYEMAEDTVYLFASRDVEEAPVIDTQKILKALFEDMKIDCEAARILAAALQATDENTRAIVIDMSAYSVDQVFQDIVARSSTIDYIVVTGSFMCSSMKPDGFGGMATVITARAVAGKSTSDLIVDLLRDLDPKCELKGHDR